MATHRKKSKTRMRAGEFAVAAFLGLAVTAAPAVATADATGGANTGPAADTDPDSKPTPGGAESPNGEGPNNGGGSPAEGGQLQEPDDEDDEGDLEADDDLGGGDLEEDDDLGEDDLEEDDHANEGLDGEADEDAEGAGSLDNEGEDGEDGDGLEGGGTGAGEVEPPVVEPPVIEPPADEALGPEGPEGPVTTLVDGPEIQRSSMLMTQDDGPQQTALVDDVLDWDFDLVPKPPVIPAFEPFNEFINVVAGWLNGLLPAYDPDPLLNPTQVAGGFVTALFAVMQGTYWNGEPTLFTFGAYVLMTAAYQRYEQLATNHLPGEPVLAAGSLPLTWKLTSVDPDGNPLLYFVDLGDQPDNGLVTMLPGGSFTFVPFNPVDLVTGTDVAFRVRVNDSLGFLTSPLTPNGNDAFFDVAFHYPGLGVDNLPPLGGLPSTTLGDGNGIVRGSIVGVIDPNNDPLSYSIKGADDATTAYTDGGGIVHVYADGRYIYIPKVNKVPLLGDVAYADAFTIVVSDGKGGTADVLVPLGVLGVTTPLNDVDVTKNLQGDGTIKGGVSLGNSNDSLLSYGVGTGPTKGSVTVNPDGTYTYTATSAGWNDTDTFTIVGTFDGLAITVATVSVVPKTNSAPTSPLTGGDTVFGGSGIASGNIGASDADNDTLHYSVTGYGGASSALLGNGSIVAVDSTGRWSYIPGLDSGFLGGIVSSFTVFITDGKGGQTSTYVTVGTHDLSIPVSKNVSNGTVTGGLGLAAGEQGLMTYKLGNQPSKGSVTVNADGTYTYTATSAGWNESDSFSIVGTIGGHDITVANVSFVPKPNAAPTAPLTGGDTVFGGSGIATGNIGASDADNDPLHYSVDGYGGASTKVLSNGAIVTVDSTGKWSYIPGLNSGVLGVVADSFRVYVSDGKGGQTSTWVTVGTHDLSIPVSKNVSNGTVTGGLGLAAGEQGLMTYKLGNQPSKGSVTVNADGTYTYTATSAGWNESDSFSIVGTIGGHDITVANVSFVPKPNAAPTAPLTGGDTVFGGSGIATGNIGASDADNDTLHYSVTGYGGASSALLGNGSIVAVDSTGRWSYIPGLDSGFLGGIVSSFTVFITDGKGGQTSTYVTVATHDLDVDVSATPVGTGKVTGGLSFDANERALFTFSGSTPGKGTVSVNADGTYTYNRTAPGHQGGATDTFDIVGTVGGVSIVVARVTVTPNLLNVAPAAGTPTFTENSTFGALGFNTHYAKGKINAVDADGDPISYPVTPILGSTFGTANNGSVTVYEDGSFSYSINGKTSSYFHAAANVNATGNTVADSFTITVIDSFGASTAITVSIPIPKWNDAPSSTLSVGGRTNDVLGVVTGTVTGSDEENDPLTYTLVGGTDGTAATVGGGIVRFAGNSFTYIPTVGTATDSFRVLIKDGHGGETVATVSLSGLTTPSPVTNINTSTDNVVTGQLNTATNTGLTYSIAGQGLKGTAVMINPATGAFKYERLGSLGHTETPDDTFTIRATDANGNSVIIARVTVTPKVQNANPFPGTWNITESKLEENKNFLGILTGDSTQTTKGILSATDPDTDAVTIKPGIYTTFDGGEVVVSAGGAFTYTIVKPNSYFHNASQDGASALQISDTFTATALDAFEGSTPFTVTVPTLKRNSNPSGSVSALTPSTRLFYSQSTTFDINLSDSDGDSTVITGVSTTTSGTTQIIGNSVKYTSYTVPNANIFNGALRYSPSESFTVFFKDGFGGTSSMQITF